MSAGQVLNKHKHGYPPGTIYIGRGSLFGNEYVIGKDGDRNAVCDLYDLALAKDERRLQSLDALIDKDVVCFCNPHRCHGDTLVKLAAMSMDGRRAWARGIIAAAASRAAAAGAQSVAGVPKQRRMF